MPAPKTWAEIANWIDSVDEEQRGIALFGTLTEKLIRVGEIRAEMLDGTNPRNVMLYASGWLQKPSAPFSSVGIVPEDINGLMACVNGMAFDDQLSLILHTPGGNPTAAQTIVSYLRSKFDDIEVIIPTYAMSAGSMIALGSDRVVMGRQSQLGPIDPQFNNPRTGATMSANGVVGVFEQAHREIVGDEDHEPVDRADLLWRPILESLGPALLNDARNALAFGEELVAEWLSEHMLKDSSHDPEQVAKHFNDADSHRNHGRRIDRDEARSVGVKIVDLEPDQDLQESVLGAYHLATIAFEKTPIQKLMITSHNRNWMKAA